VHGEREQGKRDEEGREEVPCWRSNSLDGADELLQGLRYGNVNEFFSPLSHEGSSVRGPV